MDAELTSKDFEWIWRDRLRRIGQVYRLIMIGCTHSAVLRFIEPKDRFLTQGQALRGTLLSQNVIYGERALYFRLADGEMEEAWEEVIPLVRLIS